MGMTLQIDQACWLGDDGRFHHGSIVIRDGRIVQLDVQGNGGPSPEGSTLSSIPWMPSDGQFDARGLYIVPGLIDAHVHLREPGQEYKEGIANGTAAALKGGVTTVLDMPNNQPPITTRERLDQKRELFAQKSHVNYGLFLQAVLGSPLPAPPEAAGVKIYMAKSSELEALTDVEALAAAMRGQRRVVIHAEDEREFSMVWKHSFHSVEKSSHDRRRPRVAIQRALSTIERAFLQLPESERPRLIIAHCSTIDEVEWVKRMKRLGQDVWAETCPHYFLLTREDALLEGSRLQVNPPIRSEADRVAILKAVQDGTIDFISTDHAPHTPEEKADAKAPPSGIAGVEWLGPILLSMAIRGELSWKRYLELSSQKAAACFGLKGRGAIAEGNGADLKFWDSGPVAPTPVVTRAACNPYPRFDFTARIRAVCVEGQPAWIDGRLQDAVRGREVTT